MEIKRIKRVKLGLIAFVFIMLLLVCRLFYIQIMCHEKFEAMAVSQYSVNIEGINSGQYYYFISKEKMDTRLDMLVDLLDGKKVDNGTSLYYVFTTNNFDKMANDNLKRNYNAYVFKSIGEINNNDVEVFLWADATGKIFVGQEPQKTHKNGRNPFIKEASSDNVIEKA